MCTGGEKFKNGWQLVRATFPTVDMRGTDKQREEVRMINCDNRLE